MGVRRREGGDPHPLLVCTFCGKQPTEVRKLIAGPSVYICDECVGLARGAVSSGAAASTPRGEMIAVPAGDQRVRCSFCGKYRHQVPGMAAFPSELAGRPPAVATVCTECLDLCDEIIDEEFPPAR